jgi:lipopolysaccharide/colanic/teichoic acid biosynthesis glycosyltransferase
VSRESDDRRPSRGGVALIDPRPGGLPRPVEVGLALAGLVCAAPVLAVAGLAVAVTSGLPVFFRQTRIGRGGVPFTLIKVRTMRSGGSGPAVTARGDQRVTAIGRLLRRAKIDELPELWNVVRGDMSLVGPRPEVPELVDPADPLWREVLRVRPGLTDPVTVRLRDEEKILAEASDPARFYRQTLQPQKLLGYVEYLGVRTWRRDLRVLWETALAVLHLRRG